MLSSRPGPGSYARRDELASELTFAPPPPSAAILRQVAEHIDEIIGAGTHAQRKALIDALAANAKITGPRRIVPVFRIPQPTRAEHTDSSGAMSGVRAMTNLVDLTIHNPNRSADVLVDGPATSIRLVARRR